LVPFLPALPFPSTFSGLRIRLGTRLACCRSASRAVTAVKGWHVSCSYEPSSLVEESGQARVSLDCHPAASHPRSGIQGSGGNVWLRVLRAASEPRARYRNLEALAHGDEYLSSPRRIPVLGCTRNVCRSIWMGRCPEERGGSGIQTTHCLARPCSAGSGCGANPGPRGSSDTGLTEHSYYPTQTGT